MELHQYVTDVESITLRKASGAGDQMEVIVRTKAGNMVLRLIARRGKTIRVLDMRRRDADRHRKSQFISVPMSEVMKGARK